MNTATYQRRGVAKGLAISRAIAAGVTDDWQARREETRERVIQSWRAGYASGQREARAWIAGAGFLFTLGGVVIGVVLTVLVAGAAP